MELGESHLDTIRRELDEESGATICDLTFLATIENILNCRGVRG